MFTYPKTYDVIVVGGGHAGVEAALAAARMGCETLLLTINLDTIGQMSCNPAIGGLAKGHIVREIDALGGEMAKATDMTGLQFRMLNTKKGPAVWAPRAQCDKKAYQFRLKWVCERQPRLDCKQGQTVNLLHDSGQVQGVETSLEVRYQAKTVILTTGTFLQGLMHIGHNKQSGGRAGEAAANNLSQSLKSIGLELGRLKTGTPPRLLRRSIDFSKMEPQHGDEPVPYFTFWKDDLFHVEHSGIHPSDIGHSEGTYPPGSILDRHNGQMPCFTTSTTPKTADLIRVNLHKSPMYSGSIESVGPRYCPSIEDKIVRFAEKESHQVFLEPEGISTDEFYVNGFSTCLPYEVQIELVRTIVGCENADIMRPAYAVEYDFANPTQLQLSLEAQCLKGLFLAGQINGTSGYEEAAAQGLMAGINAARQTQGASPFILKRDQAYIGVLIDDLVTKGTVEPYRMFTSRAEYRLLLRQDNADLRLSRLGHDIGLLSDRHYRIFQAKETAILNESERLHQTRIDGVTLAHLIKQTGGSYDSLPGPKPDLPKVVTDQVEIEIHYAGYISRQLKEIERIQSFDTKQIPAWFDYQTIPSLRSEARSKLSQIKPMTLGQASRISGVTPADVAILSVFLKRGPQNPQKTS